MARGRKAKKGEISSFFRPLLTQHPEWLDAPGSNQKLMARWDAEHPNQDDKERKRVMQNLANLKSLLRKKKREGAGAKRGKRGRRRAATIPAAGLTADNLMAAGSEVAPEASLQWLEEHIDDCLSEARRLDPSGLESVIHHLRLARNGVVWQMGEQAS